MMIYGEEVEETTDQIILTEEADEAEDDQIFKTETTDIMTDKEVMIQVLVTITQEIIDTKTVMVQKSLTRAIHAVTMVVQMDGAIVIPMDGLKMEEEEQLVEVAATNAEKMDILQENVLIQRLPSSQKAVLVEGDTFPKKWMTLKNCIKIAFHLVSILIGNSITF